MSTDALMQPAADFIAPIRRSKEIKAVCAALHADMEGGALRSFQEGKLRVGRMKIDICWLDGRTSRLRIDTEAATLTFPALLTGVSAGSPVYKEMKTLLRAAQGLGGELCHLRIDPSKAMLRMTEQGGKLSLAIIVTSGEYEYCMRRLVGLARDAFALSSAAESTRGNADCRTQPDRAAAGDRSAFRSRRYREGGVPNTLLKARLNAASDS
jgi:hypothetical protein